MHGPEGVRFCIRDKIAASKKKGIWMGEGQVHEGVHDWIVDQEIWAEFDACSRSMPSTEQARAKTSDALLAGKLFDDHGNRMSTSYATKADVDTATMSRRRSYRVAGEMPGTSMALRRWRWNDGSLRRYTPRPRIIWSIRSEGRAFSESPEHASPDVAADPPRRHGERLVVLRASTSTACSRRARDNPRQVPACIPGV